MSVMSNFDEFAQAVGRDVKSLNQKPEPRLTLTGITLGIVGGNHVTLPLPDNVGQEIRGTGSPEGRISAEIGATYIDTAKTNGALKWIKTTDGGNTDWKVTEGDTGWVLGWKHDTDKEAINRMYFRRINNVVHVKFEPKITDSTLSPAVNLFLSSGGDDISSDLSIQGFQPVDDVVQTIFNTSDGIYSNTAGAENSESSRGTGAVMIQYEYRYNYSVKQHEKNGLKLQIVTSELGVNQNHVNPFSYLTEDEWPTTLPIIGG